MKGKYFDNLLKLVIVPIVSIQLILTFPSLSIADQNKSSDEALWRSIDIFSSTSLNKYISEMPKGKYIDKAQNYLFLQKKIQEYKNMKNKPSFTIPFEKLEPDWRNWRKRMSYLAGVSILSKKGKIFFYPLHPSQGVGFDEYGAIGPTKNESILMFATKFSISEIVFEGASEDPLYFVVLDKLGLVYLSGKGTCTFPNGKTVSFP